ncbi:tellurite resistance TerB C-terminal domain-containing protein [Anabaena sp. UHCC 0399]|uniref:tellurite resistance TerB C-terminal domain-containing protein n=1 Tax=Anabaena sp. UHCC 0399 TaxID=3110238 RepID=UPI002B1F2EB3|nr:tellurite resistance TerB C-terminal domain-containing protein [Anabaena sp. UHCC 0399]MEA5566841.1 tellurite resistance TerB C-terminal domain-containing protein [Anabaena sp. UHCC 0399]
MQPVMFSNRFILGIVAFSVSFGLSLVPKWDFNQAFFTGVITVVATYSAALFVDRRRRTHELLILSSLRKRIKEREGLKSRVVREIEQIEAHRNLLYNETKQLQNHILECRNQRDSLHRELGNFASQKKQLESEVSNLKTELYDLEQNQAELHNFLSALTSEKRRLELHYNTSHAEINQLQTHIYELKQEQKEIESNLTLLGRIKPQLEEKLYELRLEIQNLEAEKNQQNQILLETAHEKDDVTATINSLQTQKSQQQEHLQQLKNEISVLQQERDLLQNQVWELLQQVGTFNQEPLSENSQVEDIEVFPFADLIETVESDILPETWDRFLNQLPGHEFQVLKAIVEQENPHPTIKKISEANITMPNILIDSINERASDVIGELIIETTLDKPAIYPEHISNVRQMIALYENLMTRHASSN